jgi:uncharacterized protein YneR
MDDEYQYDEKEGVEDGILLNQGAMIAFAPDKQIDLSDENSVREFIIKRGGSSSIRDGFIYSVKKYSDLNTEEQESIKKVYPKVNSEFEFIFITLRVNAKRGALVRPEVLNQLESEINSTYKISTIQTKEVDDNLPYNKGSFSTVVPKIEVEIARSRSRTSSDTIEALNNFGYLASLLLVEPRVYLDDQDSINNEKQKINNLFYNKYIIEPSFYGYSLALLNNDQEKIINQAISSKAKTIFGGGALAGAGVALLFLGPVGWVAGLGWTAAITGGAIAADGIGPKGTGLLTSINSSELNLLRIKLAGAQAATDNEELFKQILSYNKPKNIDYLHFAQNIGASDKIQNSIEYFVKDIYLKSKVFEIFQRLATNIKVGSVTAGILKKGIIQSVQEEREEDKDKITIFSSELAGGELNSFLNHLLNFPEYDSYGFVNEQDANDIFSIEERGSKLRDGRPVYKVVTLDEDLENYYYGDSGKGLKLDKDLNENFLFTAQIRYQNGTIGIQQTYFDKRKAALKQYNEKMLGFLKNLFDSLVEDAATLNFSEIYKIDPELGKALGEQNIFDLLEANAYPDIQLPRDPLLGSFKDIGASRVSPDFYFFKNKIGKLTEEERLKGKRILDKSIKFKNDLATSGVTSREDQTPAAYYDTDVFLDLIPKEKDTLINISAAKRGEDNTDSATPSLAIDIKATRELTESNITSLKDYYTEEIENKKKEINKIGSIFGNKFYTESGITSNVESIEKLTEDSFIHFNEDRGIIKAFPTFRLYLVEEDSIYSDRLLAFDDFFYYNSVISFNVYNSRELAASTATIQLQNVSGLLDGTRKSVLRDIDIETLNVSMENEDQIPTVESVVLRKGVNVQLRAGYSNNTNELDVLISGRVTEISYSGDNMVCSVVVQGYGIELELMKMNPGGSTQTANSFYSTHQLLGSLLLNPELKHFGRIKTGKLFQTFESKIPSLDIETYTSNSGWSFNWTNSWLDWISDNSGLLLAGAVVTSFLTPSIKAIGAALKAVPYLGKGITVLSKNFLPTSLVARYVAFSSKATSKMSNLFLKDRVSKEVLGRIVKLGDLNEAKLIKFMSKSIENTATKESRELILRKLTEAGISTSAATGVQIQQAINTIIQEELGLLARVYGWGASSTLAAQRVGLLPLARSGASASSGFSLRGFGRGVGKGILNYGIIAPLRLNIGILTGAAFVAAPLLVGDIIKNGVSSALDAVSDQWKKFWNESKRPNIRKLLLSPQDDGIYCPDPNTYINLKERGNRSGFPGLFNRVLKTTEDTLITGSVISFALPWLVDLNSGEITAIAKDIKERAKGLVDHRLNAKYKENEYVVSGKTIWQVLHDMTLRHPGYIYGARPYGNSMEYRVFFGLPGQRYFRKDISNFSVFRLNNIYEKISNLTNNQNLSLEDINLLFPQEVQRWGSRVSSSNKQNAESLKISYFTNYAIEYFNKNVKDRFVPFRQYHSANSGVNLVANNVIVSGHDVYNAVSVHYNITDDGGDTAVVRGTGVWRATSNKNTPPELLRENVLKDDNIKGIGSAWRYACGSLIYGAKNMYTGSLLLLGNSKINPWDIIILNDNVNLMYGPVEVKAVSHMFSHETGFLTDIEVNAVVTHVGDNTTYPTMHQTVFFEARKELFEKYISRSAFNNAVGDTKTDNFIKEIVGRKVDEYVQNTLSELDYIGIDIFSKEKREDSFKTEITQAKLKLQDAFVDYYNKQSQFAPVFLNDIIQEDAVLPEELETPIRELGRAIAATGGALAATSFGAEIFFKNVAGLQTKSFRLTGLLGAIAGGIGLFSATVGASSVRQYLSESLNSGWLGRNMFRPTILSKIDNTGLIEVYPLVKDGRPLLAGGFENAREDEKWQNILGNIYSSVSNGYKGYIENQQIIESYGKTIVYSDDIPSWIKEEALQIEGSSESIINYKGDN